MHIGQYPHHELFDPSIAWFAGSDNRMFDATRHIKKPYDAAADMNAASPTRTILLTGFSPFDGERVNPSLQIAQTLDGEMIDGHRIIGAELPTEFARSLVQLAQLIEHYRPSLVIALGQAGGRGVISLERIAINLIDARIADNAGDQPVDVRIVENAPNAYFSTLPIKAIMSRLSDAGIPAALSHSAGTFVCNQVFFGLAHMLAGREPTVRGGLIHVPYLPEQAARLTDVPSMTLARMIAGVRIAIETSLSIDEDLHYAAGSTH